MTAVSEFKIKEFTDDLLTYAEVLCDQRLAAYRTAPHDAEEHANIETAVLAGGYAYRQVAELIQNAADAIADGASLQQSNRIVVRADTRGLWCANTGAPVDAAGVKALLNSHASGKRDGQIGRFGLGFKSLLRLGGTIDVLSRTVCLHFDPARTRDRIRTHLGLSPDHQAPGLRLAEPGSWSDEIATAPGAEEYHWASTVVFAELKAPGAAEAVALEIQSFPAEFLLFLPCDVELELHTWGAVRHLRRRTHHDGTVAIEDVANERAPAAPWRVFTEQVSITDPAALEDATAVHARDTVPLIWAAPLGGTREAGRFFAFFPTTTETRTLGILNAPWKLNSDRTSVIPGAWNAALMQKAAELIADNISQIATIDDPGAVLDAFPRELVTLAEPAAPLVNALWAALTDSAVLPNCDGEAIHPAELTRAPVDDPDLIKTWAGLASADACERHLHPTCTTTAQRIGRVRQLADRLTSRDTAKIKPGLRQAPALQWLQQVATTDPHSAGDVLRLVDRFAASVQGWQWDDLRNNLRVVLTAEGRLAAAPEVSLSEIAEPPLHSVHPALRNETSLVQILRHRFDVPDDQTMGWERLLDLWIDRAHEKDDWTEVWKLLRRMMWDDFVEEAVHRDIFVRTLNGWRSADDVVRPGKLIAIEELATVSDHDRREQLSAMLLDAAFHSGDEAWLSQLGVTEMPQAKWLVYGTDDGSIGASWFSNWEQVRKRKYHASLGHRPEFHLLVTDEVRMPAAWPLLLLAPDSRKSQITCALLTTLNAGDLQPVRLRHSTRPNSWPSKLFRHPFIALLLETGQLANEHEALPLSTLVHSGAFLPEAHLPSLSDVRNGIAVVRSFIPETTSRASDDVWTAILRFASGEQCEMQVLAALYEAAAETGHVPANVTNKDAVLPLTEVYVSGSRRETALAHDAGVHAICLTQSAANLWTVRGARSLDHEAALETVSESEEIPTALLFDLEPALRDVVSTQVEARVIMPAMMERRLGSHRIEIDWTLKDGQLLIASEALDGRAWHERVALLIEAATAAGWIDDALAHDRVLSSGISARRRIVAAEANIPARLLSAVGGAEGLGSLFEPDMRELLVGNPELLAQTALNLFGPTILSRPDICAAMTEQGLRPPQRWGTEDAAAFVASIGFPQEYARSPAQRREPELAIAGPLPLKPLHDFQIDIVDELKALFADTTSIRRRSVISLPTGAGKTRVAAETAVREILATKSQSRLVVWIAQSDELCEQAVQCFKELWQNIGSIGESLRLIRLWGGQSNPSAPTLGEPVVIVASIQTLTSRRNDAALAWASKPGLIVIDECHHALTPSYTGMLRWLGTGNPGSEREPPIVGLSATPFRGRSEDETKLLASRFDNRLVPRHQASLFEVMQERGVLAKFAYSRLTMHEPFALTHEERVHFEKFQQLNDTALKRLGESRERNDRILEEIVVAKEKSALVFAASVEHAHRLAARLNIMGIRAASVSGETDRSARRWFVEAFQRGEISVICNYAALATGFDAPSTDLIVIARPVFSPALYMQMVGRGLRGPVNGGKEFCRIMTVQDNLEAYTGKLAHHYFEQHYVPAVSR